MGCSYKAILNKNNRVNKTGQHSIYIRVTVDRKYKDLNTGEKIHTNLWSGKENKWVKDSFPFAFDINELIRKKLHLLRAFEYKQKMFGNGISIESIAAHYSKKADTNIVNDYVAEYMKSVKGKSLNTLKKYRTFVKYLDEFNACIGFMELNEAFFQRFATWLRDKKKLIGVTVYKYFDPFKVICKQAVKDGYLEKDPFTNINLGIKATKGKRVYLEIEEITKLKNKALPLDRPDLSEARRHWLFCFYCGFYYRDLVELTWENVTTSPQGLVIEGSRYKNGRDYIVPIHKFPHALLILEGQKGKDETYVFPSLISDQKFNDKLKELAAAAGIQKNLMNKTARHSNIQLWSAQGLEPQHLGKMVGHTKQSTTNEYFKLTVRDINSRVSKFDFAQFDI